MKEQARFWHTDDPGPVDFLKATYYTHAFPKHAHQGYVFGVVTRGVEAFEREGSRFDAEEGCLVVINPGEIHTGFAPLDIGWSYRTIYPDAGLIRSIAQREGICPSRFPGFSSPVIHDPLLAAEFLRMHRIHEDSSSALEREEAFSGVMRRLLQEYSDCEIPRGNALPREPRAVAEVCSYLSSRHRENPRLSDLAALTGLSPWYLARVFRRTVGLPPHAWLNQYRLNRVRDLLLAGKKPAEAAAECGFTDQSHLNRHFKRYFGVTPGQVK